MPFPQIDAIVELFFANEEGASTIPITERPIIEVDLSKEDGWFQREALTDNLVIRGGAVTIRLAVPPLMWEMIERGDL